MRADTLRLLSRPAFNASVFLTVAAAVFFVPDYSRAEDTDAVVTTEAPLRAEPGGNELAAIHGGAGVKVGEVRGDWSRVTVSGWLKNDQLKKGAAKGAASAAAVDPVKLSDFSIEVLSKLVTGTKRAVKLTLKLRNDQGKPLSHWKGTMLIRDRLIQGMAGDILLRVPVSDDKAVAAGSEFTSEYYWYEGQGPFQTLANRTSKTVLIELVEVKAE